MAHARDRASLMFLLMQGTACEFLRNKAEPGPCPSGCQRQVQAMSDISQTLFVSKGHLARPLSKKSASQDLSPGERLKCLDIVHLGRHDSWRGLAALKESLSFSLHFKAAITHQQHLFRPWLWWASRGTPASSTATPNSLQAETHHPSTQINTWGTWATPNYSGFSWLFGARHWYCSALRLVSRRGQKNKRCIWRVSVCSVEARS